MPVEIYEIVALAARFWFLFLMVLIVWRSYRWYARERSQRKKRLRLLPDAGYIGELVVTQGAGDLEAGQVLSVPFEGTLGYVRSNDLCIPVPGVASRHLWFSYDDRRGLVMTPVGKNDFSVDQIPMAEAEEYLCMGHGSRLRIGECELRLRMFAGYEVNIPAQQQAVRRAEYAHGGREEPGGETAGLDAYTTFMPGQLYGDGDQGVAYGQPVQQNAPEEPDEAFEYDEPYDGEDFDLPGEDEWAEESCPEDDFAKIEDLETTVEGDLFARPMSSFAGGAHNPYARPVEPAPQVPEEMVFHPLLDDGDWEEPATVPEPVRPSQENRYAAASREKSVQAAAQQAKEAARQKTNAAARQPAAPVQPRMSPPHLSAGPHMSRPGALTRPRPLAAKAGQTGVGDPANPAAAASHRPYSPARSDEAWPVVPRPEGWRSAGLFDDLVDEDGTDASMPAGNVYGGQEKAKYFGGGDAP